MGLYLIANGPAPTTAAFATVQTGTAIKTMLQVKMGPTVTGRVVEWGCAFNASAAATPGKVELIETDVAATVTAHVAAGISKYDADALIGGDPTTDYFEVGTSATGYTASAEGTITATRLLAAPQFISPTNQFIQQLPLGRESRIQLAKFARIRMHFGADVGAFCYMLIEA